MQLFFAVAGASAGSDHVFRSLFELSRQSNPRSHITVTELPGIRVGAESRAFDWQIDESTGVTIALEGYVRSIAGVELAARLSRQATLARLHASYMELGDHLFEKMDGSYRLIIWHQSGLRVGVDIAGTRALYWFVADDMWACHSHLMDLAPTYPRVLQVHLGAVGQFCANGRYPPNLTAYRGIRHLGAGQWLIHGARGTESREHFSRAPLEPADRRPMPTLATDLIERTDAAIDSSLRASDRPVYPLSGGLDSRFIVALAVRRFGPHAVRSITWGEEPDRPSSDAVVARAVAAKLGVEHTWHQKAHAHTPETFARAIYLSSGETDHAIHFPDDHILHGELADSYGFGSIVRGDELLGGSLRRPKVLTTRGARGTAFLHAIASDPEYPALLGIDSFRAIADEQRQVIRAVMDHLHARTAYGKFLELYYLLGVRRHCAPYNAVKNTDLEVLTPLLDRRLNDWVRGLPDGAFEYKRLARLALETLDPELASIPFASNSNDGDWSTRWRTQPALPTFFAEWCERPGWLDEFDTKEVVLAAAWRLVEEARMYEAPPAEPAYSVSRSRARDLSHQLRIRLRTSTAGRLLAEQTLEYRVTHRDVTTQSRIARLAVLHGMLGEISRRRAALPSPS